MTMPNFRTFESAERCSRLMDYGDTGPGHALPGDAPVWPRDREVDVRHLLLDVRLDVPATSVSGTATHTVRALNDGLRAVTFDGIGLDVSSVTAAGVPAKWVTDGERITVSLAPPLARGEECTIAIRYSARPRMGLYFIAPDKGYPEKPAMAWTQGQDEDHRFWFPCIDFVGVKFSFELRATVPAGWTTLSNGTLFSDRDNGDGTHTVHWRQEAPLSTYLITLVAGDFARIDASRPGLPIEYLVEPGDVADGQRTFARTPEMIALFERLFGCPYPWDKYSQVVVRDFIFGGMENTSATTMTRNILFDAKAARDFDNDGLISHELAHQWFGDLLTCRDWSHGWLNEGFATYLEMLWDEYRKGRDEYDIGVLENTVFYLAERYRRPIVTKVFNEPIDLFDRHLYEKGSLVLHMLRGVLGDEPFFRSIGRYLRDNRYRSVVTSDVTDAILAETGRDLEWFFDQWTGRPGHPSFKVSWSWDDRTSSASVTVKQTQKTDDGTPLFRMPVSIDFTTGRGRPRAFTVDVCAAEQTFVFVLPAKPDLCRFDPGNNVLKELDFDKSVGELRLQLRIDESVGGRVAAAAGLGQKGGPYAVEALREAVARDRCWYVQAAAAKALGEIKGDDARTALLGLLRVRNDRARRSVVAALGQFRGDESVGDAVRPIASRDRSWFVEAEANRTIGKLRLEWSLDVLRANMERASFREVVRQGCIDGLVELRDPAGFALLWEAAAYGAPAQARQFAVAAAARLGEWFPAEKKAIAERLATFFDDPDFRVRMAAANALRALKDPSQNAALERLRARELDGRGVRAAREALNAIRKGADQPEELKSLREEFEKARDENAKLRARLDRLEATAGSRREPANS
jgi:aminopeptidase N